MGDLRHFLALLGHQRWWLCLGTLLMLAAALAGFGLLSLSGWFVTATGLTGLALAAGAAFTLDIYRPGAGIRFFAISRAVARYGERVVNHEAVLRILADLRLWFFQTLLPMPRARLGQLRDGELLNRITTDIDTLDHLYLRVLGPSITAALGLLAGFAVLAWLSPIQALPAAALLMVTAVLIPWLLYRHATPLATASARYASALRERIIGDLQAQEELHAHGLMQSRLARLAEGNTDYLGTEEQLQRQRGLAESLLQFGGLVGVWVALVLGVHVAGNDVVTGPVAVAVVLGVLALAEVTAPLPLAYQLLGRVRWSARRLRGITEGEPTMPRGTAPPPQDHTLCLRDVSYRYRPGQVPCISGITLTLTPGERIGIIGPSGGGKSTLLRLLMGDLLPNDGDTLIGSRPMRDIDQDALQACTSLLDQRATLFAASVRTNLRLGCPQAGDDTLHAAIAAMALTDTIARLPRGLDTWLGDAGRGLSGGEARRLALARTLLKPAPIVLLDEPTEGLDPPTEKRVLSGIHQLVGTRTLVVVGHDPDRLPPVDRLYALSNGQLQTP